MIYADNAATTKMSEAAINAMTACMRDTWGTVWAGPAGQGGPGGRKNADRRLPRGLPQGDHFHLRGQRGG